MQRLAAYTPRMQAASLEALSEWISAHPVAAGLLVALVALADAVPVAGMVVPSMAILLAVGTLIGLGILDPLWIIACAALGALAGDLLGYGFGRRYGERLRGLWPFTRYPHWLARGESLFQRRGALGVVIGRQIGAVRPFVPAIAGMLGMRPLQFGAAALTGALIWAPLYLAPGWLLGASWELISAVAGRLTLIVLGTLTLIAATIWLCRRGYALFAPRVGAGLERVALWARGHPRAGGLLRGLLDPNAPESAALIVFPVLLLAMTLAGLGLLAAASHAPGAPQWEVGLARLLGDLRHPLADALALRLVILGSTAHVLVSLVPGLLWLAARHRFSALRHWTGLIIAAGGVALLLHWLAPLLGLPAAQPGLHSEHFTPVAPGALLAAAGWGMFAVLVADEMPRKARAWPYVLASLIMLGVALPRLYLGLHWASALATSLLLGGALAALFGIAYRRHPRARIWQRPLVRCQLGGAGLVAVTWLLLAPANPGLLPSAPQQQLPAPWPAQRSDALPLLRDDFGSARRWPLQLQVLGDPSPLRQALLARGWQQRGPLTLRRTLGLFDFRNGAAAAPRLPTTHDGRAEVLLLFRSANQGGEWQLRLWETAWRDEDGRILHVGHVGRFVETRPFSLWRAWSLVDGPHEGLPQVRAALADVDAVVELATDDQPALLRLKTASAADTPEPRGPR